MKLASRLNLEVYNGGVADWREVQPERRLEGLKPHVRLMERSAEETNLILRGAFELSGGDVEKARQLLLQTAFYSFGKTWGDSLFVTDHDGWLPEEDLVFAAMAKMAQTDGDPGWIVSYFDQVVDDIVRYPFDLPFYGAMINDFGGKETLDLFTRANVGMPMEFAMAGTEVMAVYNLMKGRSYWEMPEGPAISSLMICYSSWRGVMDDFCPSDSDLARLPDDYQLPNPPPILVAQALVGARNRLRVLARVVLGRGFLKGNERVGHRDGLNLGVEEICGFLD